MEINEQKILFLKIPKLYQITFTAISLKQAGVLFKFEQDKLNIRVLWTP